MLSGLIDFTRMASRKAPTMLGHQGRAKVTIAAIFHNYQMLVLKDPYKLFQLFNGDPAK